MNILPSTSFGETHSQSLYNSCVQHDFNAKIHSTHWHRMMLIFILFHFLNFICMSFYSRRMQEEKRTWQRTSIDVLASTLTVFPWTNLCPTVPGTQYLQVEGHFVYSLIGPTFIKNKATIILPWNHNHVFLRRRPLLENLQRKPSTEHPWCGKKHTRPHSIHLWSIKCRYCNRENKNLVLCKETNTSHKFVAKWDRKSFPNNN